jgi:hypothetical protein
MFAEAKKRGDFGLWAAIAAIGLYAATGSALVGQRLAQAQPEVAPTAAVQLVAQR